MKKQVFRLDSDGFNGAWYPASSESGRGLIIMLGDSSEDRMAKTGAKWLNEQGIHVMARRTTDTTTTRWSASARRSRL